MAPFCPVVKKRKYATPTNKANNTTTTLQLTSSFPTSQKEENQPTLWEIKKQILFLQDMVIAKKENHHL